MLRIETSLEHVPSHSLYIGPIRSHETRDTSDRQQYGNIAGRLAAGRWPQTSWPLATKELAAGQHQYI